MTIAQAKIEDKELLQEITILSNAVMRGAISVELYYKLVDLTVAIYIQTRRV